MPPCPQLTSLFKRRLEGALMRVGPPIGPGGDCRSMAGAAAVTTPVVLLDAAFMALSVIPICPVSGWPFGRGRGAGPGLVVLPVDAVRAMGLRLAVATAAAVGAVHSAEDVAVQTAEPLAPAPTRAVAVSAAPA
jgi:hypothetical protein